MDRSHGDLSGDTCLWCGRKTNTPCFDKDEANDCINTTFVPTCDRDEEEK